MNGLTFDRGNGPVEYMIDNGEWWISWLERDIQYTEEALARARFGGVTLPDEQVLKVQLSERDLMHSLSPEELRLLMGYCSHVTEHGATHAHELISAMAQQGKDYGIIRSLNVELDECLSAIECAGATGSSIYEALAEYPVPS